jgi:hypothetical protein
MTYTQTSLELAWTAAPTASPTTLSPTHVTCRSLFMPPEFSSFAGTGFRGFHFWVPYGFHVITSLGFEPRAVGGPAVAELVVVLQLHCDRFDVRCSDWTVRYMGSGDADLELVFDGDEHLAVFASVDRVVSYGSCKQVCGILPLPVLIPKATWFGV